MVKDHSDSERKPTATTWATLSNKQQGFFYMHHLTDRIPHTTAFVVPVVEHWLERVITQWVHPMEDRSDDPSHHERTLLPGKNFSLPKFDKGFNVHIQSKLLYLYSAHFTWALVLTWVNPFIQDKIKSKID